MISIKEYKENFNQVATIGKIHKKITIDVILKHSYHSMERQGRGSEYIKNEYIKETVELATEEIIDAIINNKINVGEPIWIYNKKNNLNVVGSLLPTEKEEIYTFKLITVMFNDNFYNKKKTYKITV